MYDADSADNAAGWIAMIGGDNENANEDETAVRSSNKACRIAGGGRERIVMLMMKVGLLW